MYNNTGMDNILAKAVYEMGRARGDVSVDLRQDMNVNNNDILTSMLKRDAYTDIYVKQYDTGDFRALRNRDYLADLGSNQQIAEMTGRLYPWLQDAVKRDGKIIAVPVALYGASVNINPHAWHMLGGTEEELPRTSEAIREYREKIEPYLFPIGESKYDSETFYVELLDVMELLGSEGITNDLLIKKLDEMIVKVEMELGI